jgi:hypothetical protein
MTPSLFIFGNERSGTTLLSALLSEHPSIGVLNDTQIYRTYNDLCTPMVERVVRKGLAWKTHQRRLFARKDADRLPMMDTPIDENDVIRFYRALAVRYSRVPDQLRYFALLDPRPSFNVAGTGALTLGKLFENVYTQLVPKAYRDRAVRGEKSPEHLYISDGLRRTYPEARLLSLIRHPVPHVASLVKRRVAPSLSAAISMHLSGYDPRFEFLYDGSSALLVRYEDLVHHTSAELKRIHSYLDVEQSEAPATFDYYDRSSYIGSTIDPQRDRALRQSLDHEQRALVRARCKTVLDRFYPDEPY